VISAYNLNSWRRHLGADADPEALGRWAAGSLPEAVSAGAALNPHKQALKIGGRSCSHGDVDEAAARAAGWLRGRGVGAGERILLCADNSLELVVAYLGVLRAGAVAVPASTSLKEPELRHIVADAGAVAACASGDGLPRLRAIAADDSTLRFVVEVGDALAGEPLDPQSLRSEDVALLAYTSGTTGQPKGVPLSHRNLLWSIQAALAAWRWSENDVLVHALPLSHQHGLGGVHATLLAGSRAFIDNAFDPARLCAAIAREQATVLFAVPAMYKRLLDWGGIDDADFSSLRLIVSGSAALPRSLGESVREVFGQCPLERYGSTESGLSVSNPYYGPRRLGSVGLPLPGTELAVVDDSGGALPDGEVGEIVVRGPPVFSEYWNLPQATGESFFAGKWFRTGDLGVIDPDTGYLSITGRTKELIISGGLNVYPREIEDVLEDHRAVREAAVVGLPSERWGEEVVAFVVASDPDIHHDLGTYAQRHLAAYKCPKRIVVVDELPRNDMGKVAKDRLVERGDARPG
jgi:malonyl-CoA/methylmalonyl-CoA synthetase